MQNIIDHLRKEVNSALEAISSLDLSDEGLSGLHINKKPILLPGIRIESDKLDQVQRKINLSLSTNPIRVKLSDGKLLEAFAIDMSVTKNSMVYLNDLLDGNIT